MHRSRMAQAGTGDAMPMGTLLNNQPRFSWSESRHQRFLECPRRYYWSVYGKYNGWHPEAAPEARLAWRLAQLVPGWAIALGTTVHVRATECVAACTAGKPLPSFGTLRRAAAADLNRLYQNSRRRLDRFRAAPDRWPVLADAFYGEPWDAEEVARISARLDATLDRLLAQDWLWEAIRGAAPGDTILVDRFYNFVLQPDAITVYAAPDLLLRRRPGAPMEIWDFKIGQADGAIDQLLTYALAARDGLGIAPVDGGFLAGIVSLARQSESAPDASGDGRPSAQRFAVSAEDIDGAAARILRSAAAMTAPIRDRGQTAAPLDPSAYPQTPHRTRCARCQFRGLCEPESYPVEGVPS